MQFFYISGYESTPAHAGPTYSSPQPVCLGDPRSDPGAVTNDTTYSDVTPSYDDKHATKEHAGKKRWL